MSVIRLGDPRQGTVAAVFAADDRSRRPTDVSDVPWRASRMPDRVEPAVFPSSGHPGAASGGRLEGGAGGSARSVERFVFDPRQRLLRAEELDLARREGESAGFLRGEAEGLRRGRAEGRREGEAEGHKRGTAEAQQQLEAVRQQLGRSLLRLQQEAEQLRRAYAQTVAMLASRLAVQVVGSQRGAAPELLLQAVTVATERLGPEVAVEVRLHPADRERVAALLGEPDRQAAALRYTLVDDPSLTVGGFMLNSELGGIDGRLDEQLRRIGELLVGSVDRWRPEAGPATEEADAPLG